MQSSLDVLLDFRIEGGVVTFRSRKEKETVDRITSMHRKHVRVMYKIGEFLSVYGDGSNACVFRAHADVCERFVACFPELLRSPGARTWVVVDRFCVTNVRPPALSQFAQLQIVLPGHVGPAYSLSLETQVPQDPAWREFVEKIYAPSF